MLVTMKELLDKASAGNYAVAAPNVSNELNARACIEAAEDMKAPLILDVASMAAVDIQFLPKVLMGRARGAVEHQREVVGGLLDLSQTVKDLTHRLHPDPAPLGPA